MRHLPGRWRAGGGPGEAAHRTGVSTAPATRMPGACKQGLRAEVGVDTVGPKLDDADKCRGDGGHVYPNTGRWGPNDAQNAAS